MPEGAARWMADPTRRHELRWWNGTRWTEHVADDDVMSIDWGPQGPPAGVQVQATATSTSPEDYVWGPWVAIAIGGGATIMGALLPWAKATAGAVDATVTGTDGNLGKLVLLAGAALVVLGFLAGKVEHLPLVGWISLALGALSAVLCIFKTTDVGSAAKELKVASALVDVSVGIGLYVAIAAGIAAAVGGGLAVAQGNRLRE